MSWMMGKGEGLGLSVFSGLNNWKERFYHLLGRKNCSWGGCSAGVCFQTLGLRCLLEIQEERLSWQLDLRVWSGGQI